MNEQTVRRTFKYKLRPTAEQRRLLDQTLMLCRHVYNAAVGERRAAWRMCGVSVGYYQQKAELPEIKAEMPEYGAVYAQVLQDVVLRVDRAFQAFFRRLKNGESPGYPRFHGPTRYSSFTYPQYGNGARLDNGFLILSKIGRIAVRWSRPIAGTAKTVTLRREADGWYVCLSCMEVPRQPLPPAGQETGIDLGVESFATLANGTRIVNPRCYRKAERTLKAAQRRISRRQKGSGRCRKAVTLLAKAHLKVKRQRRDFHHKVALHLVQTNDTIYHEDLQTANMVRNHHLAKSISDAGWSRFLSILVAKAAYAGRRVVAVPPAYTSQKCSGCGAIVAKGLSARWHLCPDCGTSLHRDHNAARNIERARGKSMTTSTLYEQRKAARLCCRCAAALMPDETGVRCSACAQRMRSYQRARHSRRISENLCLDCGQPTGGKRRKCAHCRRRDVGYALNKSRQLAVEGLCVDCGKAQPLDTLAANTRYKLCETCYFQRAALRRLGSRKEWRSLRDKLIAQDYRCPYTGEHLVLGGNDSVDHIYPVARFPERAHDLDNVEWISRAVNEMKRDRTPEEFLSLIALILAYRQNSGAGQALRGGAAMAAS